MGGGVLAWQARWFVSFVEPPGKLQLKTKKCLEKGMHFQKAAGGWIGWKNHLPHHSPSWANFSQQIKPTVRFYLCWAQPGTVLGKICPVATNAVSLRSGRMKGILHLPVILSGSCSWCQFVLLVILQNWVTLYWRGLRRLMYKLQHFSKLGREEWAKSHEARM